MAFPQKKFEINIPDPLLERLSIIAEKEKQGIEALILEALNHTVTVAELAEAKEVKLWEMYEDLLNSARYEISDF